VEDPNLTIELIFESNEYNLYVMLSIKADIRVSFVRVRSYCFSVRIDTNFDILIETSLQNTLETELEINNYDLTEKVCSSILNRDLILFDMLEIANYK
jgi:hypothetical protein